MTYMLDFKKIFVRRQPLYPPAAIERRAYNYPARWLILSCWLSNNQLRTGLPLIGNSSALSALRSPAGLRLFGLLQFRAGRCIRLATNLPQKYQDRTLQRCPLDLIRQIADGR